MFLMVGFWGAVGILVAVLSSIRPGSSDKSSHILYLSYEKATKTVPGLTHAYGEGAPLAAHFHKLLSRRVIPSLKPGSCCAGHGWDRNVCFQHLLLPFP